MKTNHRLEMFWWRPDHQPLPPVQGGGDWKLHTWLPSPLFTGYRWRLVHFRSLHYQTGRRGGGYMNMVKTTFRSILLLLIFYLCGVTPHWGLTDIRISSPFSSSNPRTYLAAALHANYWVTPNPSFELRHTPTELSHTPISIVVAFRNLVDEI